MKNVITISRQMGSGGRRIAALISEELGWPMVGKEMVTRAAAEAGVDEIKIERVFEHRLSLQDRITFQQKSEKYLLAIGNVIRELADKGDVVLLGRGAHLILSDYANIFKVHLVAEFEVRVRRISEQFKLKGKKGEEEARRMVIDSDYARTAYQNYLFNTEWNDPLNNDLTLNTTELDIEQSAQIILKAFEIAK